MTGPVPQIVHYQARDNARLAVRRWAAEDPLGRVLFLHGITSHGGWYGRTCSQLVRAGLEVHFLDRRGSGLNTASRGDVDSYRTWIHDVEDYGRSLSDGVRTILAGISWGGKLAVAVAQHGRLQLAGIALVCPGLFARQYPGPLKRLLVRAACGMGLSSRRVAIPLRDPRLFTSDPEHREYVLKDPLALRRLTLRFVAADLDLTHRVRASFEPLPDPVLLLLAGQDQIIDNRRVRRFITDRSKDPQIIEYPEAHHTMEFDTAGQAYASDLSAWARQILRAKTAPCPGS